MTAVRKVPLPLPNRMLTLAEEKPNVVTARSIFPSPLTVVGIAVHRVDVFDERLSTSVAGAVGPAVEAILAALGHRPVEVA